jgi:hypothetical protein
LVARSKENVRKSEDASVSLYEQPARFTSVFSSELAAKYLDVWGIIPAFQRGLLRVQWDPSETRVVFLIYGCDGKLRDAIGRAIRPKVIPKWKRYGSWQGGFLIHPQGAPWEKVDFNGLAGPELVLVEDCLSAVRVALSGYRAMALLGTHLTAEVKRSLAGERVILALDADASRLAVKMTATLAFYTKQVSLRLLDDDLKYLTTDQVRSILQA